MKILKQLFSLGEDQDYRRGIDHFNAHRYHQAIEAFRAVLNKRVPKKGLYHNLSRFYAAQAYRNLGTVAFAAGKFHEALEQFQHALELNPEHADLNFFIGISFNNLGDFDHAVKAFIAALAVDPDHLPTQMKLAVVFHNLKLWDSAATTYRSILLQRPEYADVHYRLGLALLGAGKIEDAIAAFEAALKINAEYVDARIKAGIAHAQQGKIDAALDHLCRVIAGSPEYADVHYLIGLVHEHGQNLEESARSLEQAVRINPAYKAAKVKLATICIRLRRFRDALAFFESAAEQAADDPGLQLAVEMIQNRLDQPFQDPVEIQKALEEVLGDTGSIPATIESSCCQIDITPHFTEMISLVNVAGDERETMPVSELLVPLFEDHVKTHPAYPDLRHSLGLLYLRLKRFDDAEKAFTEAVRLNPNYIKARVDLLKTLIRNKKFSQALPHGEFILSKGIKYPDVFLSLGEATCVLGNLDGALAYAENALAVKPSFTAAYCLMGRILEQTGKTREAILAYTQVMNLDAPRSLKQDAEEGIKRLSSKKEA